MTKTLKTKNKVSNKTKNFTSKTYLSSSVELQKKLINHIIKNGKKHKSEKNIAKSFKATQKNQKKNHGKITKLSILNTIPTFKIIKLTDKKRRR